MADSGTTLWRAEPAAATPTARQGPTWTARQRAKNDVLYALARAAMWIVGRLPLGMGLLVGELVGLAGFALARRERHKALAGLALAYPDSPERVRRAIARRCFAGLGRSAAEVCRLARLGRSASDWIGGYVSVPDLPLVERLLAEGKGLVWVTAHLGNWELLAAGLGAQRLVVRPFAKPSYDPRFTRMIDRWRRTVGVETIWRGEGDAGRQVGETLAAGGIVGALVDQDTSVRGGFVPFFGRPAWTPTGAAELARTTGAPIVAGFIARRPGGGHEVRAERILLRETGDGEADDLANTAELTRAIERAVRERPEDWVWMHERWKTSPRSDPGGIA